MTRGMLVTPNLDTTETIIKDLFDIREDSLLTIIPDVKMTTRRMCDIPFTKLDILILDLRGMNNSKEIVKVIRHYKNSPSNTARTGVFISENQIDLLDLIQKEECQFVIIDNKNIKKSIENLTSNVEVDSETMTIYK